MIKLQIARLLLSHEETTPAMLIEVGIKNRDELSLHLIDAEDWQALAKLAQFKWFNQKIVIESCCELDNVQVIKELHERGFIPDMDAHVMTQAHQKQAMKILELYYKLGRPLPENIWKNSLEAGRLGVVKWLLAQGVPMPDDNTVILSALYGGDSMLEFIEPMGLKLTLPIDTKELRSCITNAIGSKGRKKALEYIKGIRGLLLTLSHHGNHELLRTLKLEGFTVVDMS